MSGRMSSTNTRADIARTRVLDMTVRTAFGDKSNYDDPQSVSAADMERFEAVFDKFAADGGLVSESQLRPMMEELGVRLSSVLMEELVTSELAAVSDEGNQVEGKHKSDGRAIGLEDWLHVLSLAYAPPYLYGEQLGRAAARSDVPTLRELVCRGCHPNSVDGRGYTALHFAAEAGAVESIKALKAECKELNADAPDSNGWTPLIIAASNGHDKAVRALRNIGASVDRATAEGRTALHWASTKGKNEVVLSLLSDGADKNARDRMGWTPLHCAVINGDSAVVHTLIMTGADVTVTDECGYASRHYCDELTTLAYEAAIAEKTAPNKRKKK